MLHSRIGAPGRTRTDTGRILSPLSLPLDYGGHEQEVDCTPMEGFNPDAVDAILGLRERGLRSVVLLPLGYRDTEGDWLYPMPKVRKSRAAMVTDLA